MSVEGVWKVEMLGPHGWEPIATAFLRKGRYHAASADHYSIGSYKEAGENFNVEARTTQHGNIGTVFGSKKKHLDILMEGRIKKGDKIVGTARPSGGANLEVSVCLTRLGGLD